MYAKLIDNELIFAPNVISKEDKTIFNPQASDYNSAGFKEVVYLNTLQDTQGLIPKAVYSEEGNKIIVNYVYEDPIQTTQEQEIKQKLIELDFKSIRPLRAQETERLAEYEQQAQIYREQLRALTGTSS